MYILKKKKTIRIALVIGVLIMLLLIMRFNRNIINQFSLVNKIKAETETEIGDIKINADIKSETEDEYICLVTFESRNSNKKIVKIEELDETNRVITSKGEGKNKIGLDYKIEKNNIKGKFRITTNDGETVIKEIKVLDIKPEKDSLKIAKGEEFKINPIMIQSNDNNEELVYESTDTGIVNVDTNGVIKGVEPGTTTIKVTEVNSEKETEYEIVVEELEVYLDETNPDVESSDSLRLYGKGIGEFEGLNTYTYYVYEGDDLVAAYTTTDEANWLATELIPTTEYTMYIKMVDDFGNEIISEELHYTKQIVYSWNTYETKQVFSEYTYASTYLR